MYHTIQAHAGTHGPSSLHNGNEYGQSRGRKNYSQLTPGGILLKMPMLLSLSWLTEGPPAEAEVIAEARNSSRPLMKPSCLLSLLRAI